MPHISAIFVNFVIINPTIAKMKFLHYLYVKGEANFRLGGRGLIVAPIWLFTLFFSTELFPPNLFNEFEFLAITLCFLAVITKISYIIIPKKEVKLKAWERKYKKITSLWAYLYFFSPLIVLWIYLIIRFG